MYSIERDLAREGASPVAGVDEAGRGPLAGPVVAAAVVLDPGNPVAGLADSKKLTPRQREALLPEILAKARAVALAAAGPREIERINILQASLRAMATAVEGLRLYARARTRRRQQEDSGKTPADPPGEGGFAVRLHRRGERGRQGVPGPGDGPDGGAFSGLRLRQAQGLSHAGSPGRPRTIWPLPHPPAHVPGRACGGRSMKTL